MREGGRDRVMREGGIGDEGRRDRVMREGGIG